MMRSDGRQMWSFRENGLSTSVSNTQCPAPAKGSGVSRCALARVDFRQHRRNAHRNWGVPKTMTRPVLGILTGISYVSGLDYFRGINERFCAGTPQGHLMVPNPPIVMASVDCDEYVHYLTSKAFDRVAEHLLEGVRKLVAAGCDLLVIASNTGHIAVPAIEKEFPSLRVLHIADCFAYRLKQQGIRNVGLIGTKPTMEEDYLRSRLSLHGISTVVPEEVSLQEEIYDIICQELSFNILKEESRAIMVGAILRLKERGAEACILGCTEIELLVKQEHVRDLALFPSAEIHIEMAASVLLREISLEEVRAPPL